MLTYTQRATQDLAEGLKSPQTWLYLAWDDVNARYRRTLLGPFWQTALHGATILGLSLLFSNVFGRDATSYLLYLAAGLTVWMFLSSTLVEGTFSLTRGAPLIAAYPLPASIHMFRAVTQQLILLGHNLVIYLLVLIYTGFSPGWTALVAIPGLAVMSLFGLGWCFGMGVLGARFRDVTPAVTAAVNFLYLLTPIFWWRGDLSQSEWIVQFNPFYHLLELVRMPMLGQMPTSQNWIVGLSAMAISVVLGTLIFLRDRKNISYWL